MDTTDSNNSATKTPGAARTRVLVAAGIVAIASVTGVTVSAQVYALRGLNGQLAPVTTSNWLPTGLNATFSKAMLYRNSHLRTIAKHVVEKAQSDTNILYSQALLVKLDDWDTRINALLKANNIDTSFADNQLNFSYQEFEKLATRLSAFEGKELDSRFKGQMSVLSKQSRGELEADISLLNDKQLEGIAAEISGSNNSFTQDTNAG
jgi:hypothetical protein